MLIAERDYNNIHQLLHDQRWDNGYEYVVYPNSETSVDIHDLRWYQSEIDALEYLEYCDVVSNGSDHHSIISIRSSYRAMSEGKEGLIPITKRNGLVDIAAMVDSHYQRMKNQELTTNKKGVVMNNEKFNQENFEYLDNQVAGTGVKQFPADQLKSKMAKKKKEFEINLNLDVDTHVGKGQGKANVSLKFSKSEKTDMYFFNKYDMEIQREGEKQPLKQTFYTNNRLTMKEAFNLLEGRAVFKTLTAKEGGKYNVWMQLDFMNTDQNGNYLINKYGEKYGFDLEEKLKTYPIKELDNPQQMASINERMQNGDRVAVTFIDTKGKEHKRYIEASPKFKTINIFGEDQKLRLAESQRLGQSQKEDVPAQQQSATAGQRIGNRTNNAASERNQPPRQTTSRGRTAGRSASA